MQKIDIDKVYRFVASITIVTVVVAMIIGIWVAISYPETLAESPVKKVVPEAYLVIVSLLAIGCVGSVLSILLKVVKFFTL